MTELWVNRSDYRDTKIVETEAMSLGEDEVRATIDKFALTANNVSYAVSGDMIGYWGFYPADEGWGKVPVWGLATISESANPEIEVGEQIYGFFPMADSVVLKAGKVRDGQFTDVADHRSKLPGLYNNYMRTRTEPGFLKTIEDERCLYFPLFITSYVIADLIKANDYFGAGQVIIGSVSSKTGFGLAHFLKADDGFKGEIIGLTSPGNVDFVNRLGMCSKVVAYGDEESAIDADLDAVYVDMAGNGPLRRVLHGHLQERMKSSQMVGATHWESSRKREDLPGARPELFFAPAQIAARDAEWGRGVLMKQAYAACAELALSLKGQVAIDHIEGAEGLQDIWRTMLDNSVPPSKGIMVRVG